MVECCATEVNRHHVTFGQVVESVKATLQEGLGLQTGIVSNNKMANALTSESMSQRVIDGIRLEDAVLMSINRYIGNAFYKAGDTSTDCVITQFGSRAVYLTFIRDDIVELTLSAIIHLSGHPMTQAETNIPFRSRL